MWKPVVALGGALALGPATPAAAATEGERRLGEDAGEAVHEDAATTVRSEALIDERAMVQLEGEARRQLRSALNEARADRWAEKRAERRRSARRAAAVAAAAAPAVSPALESIAACESGGNPAAVGGGGAYRGKYQFDYATWAAIGGSGDPASAPEAEQDRRAAVLYARTGGSSWPACSG